MMKFIFLSFIFILAYSSKSFCQIPRVSYPGINSNGSTPIPTIPVDSTTKKDSTKCKLKSNSIAVYMDDLPEHTDDERNLLGLKIAVYYGVVRSIPLTNLPEFLTGLDTLNFDNLGSIVMSSEPIKSRIQDELKSKAKALAPMLEGKNVPVSGGFQARYEEGILGYLLSTSSYNYAGNATVKCKNDTVTVFLETTWTVSDEIDAKSCWEIYKEYGWGGFNAGHIIETLIGDLLFDKLLDNNFGVTGTIKVKALCKFY